MPTDITNKQKISKDQLQLQNLKLTEEGIAELYKRQDQLRISVRELRTVNGELESKAQQFSERNEKLMCKNYELIHENQQLKDFIQTTEEELKEAKKIKERNEKLMCKNFELIHENQRLKDLTQTNEEPKVQSNQHQKELEYAIKRADVLDKKIQQKEKMINDLCTINNKQKKKIEELQHELNNQMKDTFENININNQLNDLLTNLELKKLENEQLTEHNKRLLARIEELEQKQVKVKTKTNDRQSRQENTPPETDMDLEEEALIPRLKRTLSLSYPSDNNTSKEEPRTKKRTPSRVIKQEPSTATDCASSKLINTNHRYHRQHMVGEACVSCVEFYGDETFTVQDKNGIPTTVSSKDRIQMNSKHRHHPKERASTPPGFWDLEEFLSSQRNDRK